MTKPRSKKDWCMFRRDHWTSTQRVQFCSIMTRGCLTRKGGVINTSKCRRKERSLKRALGIGK